MIFTDTRLVERDYEVRFFYYSDINMGIGDSGTAFYALVPRSELIGRIKKRHITVGGVFYDYIIRPSYLDKLNFNHMEMGYTLAKAGQREKEIKRHEDALSKLTLR